MQLVCVDCVIRCGFLGTDCSTWRCVGVSFGTMVGWASLYLSRVGVGVAVCLAFTVPAALYGTFSGFQPGNFVIPHPTTVAIDRLWLLKCVSSLRFLKYESSTFWLRLLFLL